jgi:5-dehydro-2-deoxygluconokinase
LSARRRNQYRRGSDDLLTSLATVRQLAPQATLVVKRGPLGCAVIPAAIPARIEDAFSVKGAQVEVMNVLGAGDAFLSGFLSGWLQAAITAGAAPVPMPAGAGGVAPWLLASHAHHGELDYFLGLEKHRCVRVTMPPSAACTGSASSASSGMTCACLPSTTATSFSSWRGKAGRTRRISVLKRLLVEAVAQTESALQLQGHIGILVDDRYGEDAMYAATGRGWWIGRPVELPGSNPLEFDRGRTATARLEAGRRNTSSNVWCSTTRTTRWKTGWSRKPRCAPFTRQRN